jgi:1-acyl-sn-glycerol-3-phosphate acyltransferase
MGIGLSFRTAYQLARAAIPTFADGMRGGVRRADVDHRARAFGAAVVEMADIHLTVEGAARIPADRAFVYMSNHQSHVDIPVLYQALPARTLRMVAKTELFRIPIFGAAMRTAEFVEIDRGDRERAIASLGRAAALIADGVSVWIAPEGSRSRTGAIGPLKKGGFHLAADTGTPIVPVAIDGTRHILPPGKTAMRRGVAVHVVVGAPIEVAGRSIEALMDEVRAFLVANVSCEA